MKLPGSMLALVVTGSLAVVGLVGCGDDSSSKDTSKGVSATSVTSNDAGDTSDTASSGSGDEKAVDVCTQLTADEVGAILGGVVTAEDVPGGGCNFSQDDPRAPSVAFNTSSESDAGGFETATYGVTSVIEGDKESVDIGDQAIVVIGTALGGSNQQGGGLTQVGDSLVQVTLTQGTGLAAEQVKGLTTQLVQLAADKA